MTDIIPFLIVIGVIAFSLVGKAFSTISKKQGQAGGRRGAQPPHKPFMPYTDTTSGPSAEFPKFPDISFEEWFPGEHKQENTISTTTIDDWLHGESKHVNKTPPPIPTKKKKNKKRKALTTIPSKGNTAMPEVKNKQTDTVYTQNDISATNAVDDIDWKKAIIAHEILKRKF